MKRISKEELQSEALSIAKAHKVDCVYATEDGNYFLPGNKSLAFDHHAKVVKKEFEAAELLEFKVEAEASTVLLTEAQQTEACKAKAIELSEGKAMKPADLKKALKKEGFSKEVIDAVVNEMTTHQE